MGSITIIGLGPGNINNLTVEAYKLLTSNKVYLRTSIHPCIKELEALGCDFENFDNFYDESPSFEEVYSKIVDFLLNKAKTEDIFYAVPGNPLINETTVTLLIEACRKEEIPYTVVEGLSYIDVLATTLNVDIGKGFELVDSYDIIERNFRLNKGLPVIINQVYDKAILSEVKLSLLEMYNDEIEVALVENAGLENELIIWDKLYKIDRYDCNHLSSLYIPKQENNLNEFESLVKTIATLRGPNGCPWDKEQTHESLKRYFIEETHEVIDAIDNDDIDNLEEELGDVLFQVLIHSQLAKEEELFNIYNVIEKINEKMIRRHPHVFGNVDAENYEVIFENWDKIKETEKPETSISEQMLSIPKTLPNLLIADKVQRKAKKVGFDWDEPMPALDKVLEEVDEVKAEVEKGNKEALEEELGDLIFAVVNAARLLDVDAHEALNKANRKFINRFKRMEDYAKSQGQDFYELNLDEQEAIWQKIKHIKNNENR